MVAKIDGADKPRAARDRLNDLAITVPSVRRIAIESPLSFLRISARRMLGVLQ